MYHIYSVNSQTHQRERGDDLRGLLWRWRRKRSVEEMRQGDVDTSRRGREWTESEKERKKERCSFCVICAWWSFMWCSVSQKHRMWTSVEVTDPLTLQDRRDRVCVCFYSYISVMLMSLCGCVCAVCFAVFKLMYVILFISLPLYVWMIVSNQIQLY